MKLADMNYREQDWPDCCYVCKNKLKWGEEVYHCKKTDEVVRTVNPYTGKTQYKHLSDKIELIGYCDHFERSA